MSAKEKPLHLYHPPPIVLRPFHLLCLVCRQGEQRAEAEPATTFWAHTDRFLGELWQRIRNAPDHPLVLVCNAGDVFAYQEPALSGDSPEGADYNLKRDLDMLRALDLPPGIVLPAGALLHRLRNTITTVRNICGYDTCTSEAWKGCARADSGSYERGIRISLDELLPFRSDARRAEDKAQSLAAMRSAASVTIRPHLLLCAVCQYGAGIRGTLDADNLPELIQLVLAKPDARITLARGADWMMCAPCKRRVDELNACVNVWGTGGLSNELRDLNVLRQLGLTYGATMPAGELFRLLFDRLPTTVPICTKDNPKSSVWWDTCGDRTSGNQHYLTGRQALREAGLEKGGQESFLVAMAQKASALRFFTPQSEKAPVPFSALDGNTSTMPPRLRRSRQRL